MPGGERAREGTVRKRHEGRTTGALCSMQQADGAARGPRVDAAEGTEGLCRRILRPEGEDPGLVADPAEPGGWPRMPGGGTPANPRGTSGKKPDVRRPLVRDIVKTAGNRSGGHAQTVCGPGSTCLQAGEFPSVGESHDAGTPGEAADEMVLRGAEAGRGICAWPEEDGRRRTAGARDRSDSELPGPIPSLPGGGDRPGIAVKVRIRRGKTSEDEGNTGQIPLSSQQQGGTICMTE